MRIAFVHDGLLIRCWVFDILALGQPRLIAVRSLPAALMRAITSRCVFDHGRHVVGVGVNDGAGVARDRHMVFPENQIDRA